MVTSVETRGRRAAAGSGGYAGRVAAWARKPWLLRAASIVFVLGLWQWGAAVSVNPAFPSCSATLEAFWEMLVDGTFADAYAQTAGPLIVGVLLTAIGGVLAGLVMGLSPRAEWLGFLCSSSSRPRRRRRSSR